MRPSTNVRYGFVTCSSAVNGGGAIMGVAPEMIVGNSYSETAPYESREITGEYQVSTKVTNENNGKTQVNCKAATRTPVQDNTFDGSSGTARKINGSWENVNNNWVCRVRDDVLGPIWTYRQLDLDAQQFVASGRTGAGADDPTKARNTVSKWGGCLEESAAATTAGATTFNVTSLPTDLNPDATRSGSTRWFPHCQDVTYARNASGAQYALGFSSRNTAITKGDVTSSNPNYGSASMLQNFASVCGKPAQRLAALTRAQVTSFVTAPLFHAAGQHVPRHRHDLGRAAALANGPVRGRHRPLAEPHRAQQVIVFMTDGDMQSSTSAYGVHGIEYFGRRVSGSNTGGLDNYHSKRLLAACSAAKARNIDVWVVQIDSAASADMQACATTKGQALFTTSGDGLSEAFATIAEHLAMLRITL